MIPTGEPLPRTVSDLAAGDLLLCHNGQKEVAKWVQCLDSSLYQHAAVYVGRPASRTGGDVIQAGISQGVARMPVEDLLAVQDFIDIYQVRKNGDRVGGNAISTKALACLGAKYNFAVIPHFIALYKEKCGFPDKALREAISDLRRASWSPARSAGARRPKEGGQRPGEPPRQRPEPMTCSQFVFECCRPLLDDLLLEVQSGSETLASRAAADLSGPDVLFLVAPDRKADEPDRLPAGLRDALRDLAENIYPESVPAIAIRDADEPDVARYMPGPLGRQIAVFKLHQRTAAFVSPGHLSRAQNTVCVGRITRSLPAPRSTSPS